MVGESVGIELPTTEVALLALLSGSRSLLVVVTVAVFRS